MFDDFLFDLRLAEIFGRSNILGLKVISTSGNLYIQIDEGARLHLVSLIMVPH